MNLMESKNLKPAMELLTKYESLCRVLQCYGDFKNQSATLKVCGGVHTEDGGRNAEVSLDREEVRDILTRRAKHIRDQLYRLGVKCCNVPRPEWKRIQDFHCAFANRIVGRKRAREGAVPFTANERHVIRLVSQPPADEQDAIVSEFCRDYDTDLYIVRAYFKANPRWLESIQSEEN